MEYLGLFLSAFVALVHYYKGQLIFSEKTIKILTTFSGSYLLGITFLHIIPEVFTETHGTDGHNHADYSFIGFFVLIGFGFQLLLDYWSKGIEHGHVHGKIGLGVVVALSIHSFFEAMPLLSHADHPHDKMLIGIILHKIPVALVLANVLRNNKSPKNIYWIILFILSAPLGMFLGSTFTIIAEFHKELLAIVIGLLMHISTTILFESTANHTFNRKKMEAILLGFAIAIIFSIV